MAKATRKETTNNRREEATMEHCDNEFLVIDQGEGRVAMRRDCILSVYETNLEGDDYLAFEMKTGITFYSADLTMDDVLGCPFFQKGYKQGAGSSGFHFLAVNEDSGKTAIRTDRIVSISETDIEGEYFISLRMRGGNDIDSNDSHFDEVMKHLSFYELSPENAG